MPQFVYFRLHSTRNKFVHDPHYSKAFDTETKKCVALKKLARPFQSDVLAKRTYREVTLLKLLTRTNTNVSCEQVAAIRDPYPRLSIPCNPCLASLQVVELLEVFTPDETFESFTDV